MKNILIALAKAIAILAGLAMLVGGGLCSFITPFFMRFTDDAMMFFTLAVIGISLMLLIWLAIKLYQQYLSTLLLIIAVFFLVGGGLCADGSGKNVSAWGLLLLDIAVALSGYVLIRRVADNKKPLPPSDTNFPPNT